MPRADWKIMKRYPVAVPGDRTGLAAKFQDHFLPITEKIAGHALEGHELTRLRDWLLPLLMNGQVRVAP